MEGSAKRLCAQHMFSSAGLVARLDDRTGEQICDCFGTTITHLWNMGPTAPM